MSKKIRYTICFLCIMATILIVTGAILELKELISEEELFNVADDSDYFKVVFNLNGATNIDNKSVRCKNNNGKCSVTLRRYEAAGSYLPLRYRSPWL